MIENERPTGRQTAGVSESQVMRVLLTHAAVAVLSVLLSGSAWADESSRDSAEHRDEAATPISSNSREAFGNAPPPQDQSMAGQTPRKPPGSSKSRFADAPPPVTTRPDAVKGSGTTGAGSDPTKVRIRKGDLEVDIEIPSEQRKKPSSGQAQKTNGKKKDKKRPNRDLVKKEQEKALNQRNAGKKATEGLDRVHKQAQTGLETAIDNMGRAVKAIDQLGPRLTAQDGDTGAVDLGESDTLGDLD